MKNCKDTTKAVCSTWFKGELIDNLLAEYTKTHIPGSPYFGIMDIADKSSGLSATLPKTNDFVREMRRLGLKKSDTIVIYEHNRIMSAPRVSWMLRIFGAKDVRILNGCLKKWISEGRSVVNGTTFDVNDNSTEGYDYKIKDSMYATLRPTMQKVYQTES